MRQMVFTLLTMALVISVVSISLARAGPTKKTFMADQVSTIDVAAPTMASRAVPLMTGYDVICNLTTEYKNKVQVLAERRANRQNILALDRDVGLTSLRRPEIVLLA